MIYWGYFVKAVLVAVKSTYGSITISAAVGKCTNFKISSSIVLHQK